MKFKVESINSENRQLYKEVVLSWLADDYIQKDGPAEHSYNHSDLIKKAFSNNNAMVALNHDDTILGYMIWNTCEANAEIELVEVKEEYRRQGIFKAMLERFKLEQTAIYILSVNVTKNSEIVYKHMGWQKVNNNSGGMRYVNVLKNGILPSNDLPGGRVIALCPKDYCEVNANIEKFQDEIKCFQIELDLKQELITPIIIVNFYNEGGLDKNNFYVSIYQDKRLIDEGRVESLFKNIIYYPDTNILLIKSIIPCKPELFDQNGFFIKPKHTISNKYGVSKFFSQINEVANDNVEGSNFIYEKPKKLLIISYLMVHYKYY